MDTNTEVACMLDEELLANIKTSDNEEDEIKMEQDCLAQLPTPDADYKDCNLNWDATDPLQESNAVASNFAWLFKDSDLLYTVEQLANLILQPGVHAKNNTPVKGRSKRGRRTVNNNSYTSSSGCTWTLDRDALASQQELPFSTHQACGKGPARTISNAVEAWMLLFDDEMLRQLCRHINEQIRKRHTTGAGQRPTDLSELRSWLGLTYLCGVFRNAQHNGPLEELWTLELGNVIFRATMTLTRFEFLTECLCWEQSMNEAMRMWQKLLINCRSYYGPSSWLCVDEQPSNVDNLRLAVCCDAKTLYMSNAALLKSKVASYKDLEQVICDYKTTGRNVTLGTKYANVHNCQMLLQRQLSTICKLNEAAEDYPTGWSATADHILYSGVLTLISQEGHNVMTCGLSNQVNVLLAQLNTEKAAATFYEQSNRYSTTFATPRCQLKSPTFLQFLHLILNTAAFNAWILIRLSPKGDANIEQRDFQRQLGLYLTQQRLQRRILRRSTTSLVTKLQICEILGQSSQHVLMEATKDAQQTQAIGAISFDSAALPKGVTLSSRYGEKHRRCKPCSRSKRGTKARTRCQQCLAHRCGNHLIARCYECMGVTPPQIP